MISNSIFIATPAYGEVFYSVYVQSLFGLQHELARRRWPSGFATLSFSDIVESRSVLLTHWFDRTNASHLLFVDADMGFEPKLVINMVELNEPLVGVIAPKRRLDLNKLIASLGAGEPPLRALAKAHDYAVMGPGVGAREGFIRVEGCGAGILLVRRDCIATMLQSYPDLSDETAPSTSPIAQGLDRVIRVFDPIRLETARLSEDYAFCYRWRRCGGDIWAAADREIVHVGLHKFRSRYSDQRPSSTGAVHANTSAAQVATLNRKKSAAPAGAARPGFDQPKVKAAKG